MARVDPAAIEILRDLPKKHRDYLLRKFGGELRKSWNQQRKFERIAELLGPNGVTRYVDLYLPGNGSLFTWYLGRDSAKNHVAAIYNRMTKDHPGILSGLFPKLTEDDLTPKLHRLHDYGNYIAVEFASLDATRTFTVNWKTEKVHVDRLYRVVLRNNPFTIEVRASGDENQDKLIGLIGDESGIRKLKDAVTRCALSDAKRRNRLDRAMKARFCGSDLDCSADGLSSMKLRSATGERMDASGEYKKQMDREGRDETRRSYEFVAQHIDGYDETAEYTVGVDSGEVRVSSGASEIAIEKLRQHVVKLF